MAKLAQLFVGILLTGAPLRASAAAFDWVDPETKQAYQLLEGEHTFDEAEALCHEQGMAVFDTRLVSNKEALAFLASPVVDHLAWSDRPGGAKLAAFWGTLQYVPTIGAPSDFWAVGVVLSKREGQPAVAANERLSASYSTRQAVCMGVEAFWYRCTVNLVCSYNNNGTRIYERTAFRDYGRTEAEIMRRITEETQSPRWASTADCGLDTSSRSCERVLP
jgi:hypothetical protein